MFHRIFNPLKTKSFFLFGARQTGKSTLIDVLLEPINGVWSINLLKSDIYFRYLNNPSLFRTEAEEKISKEKTKIIFIDEVQRIPELLNEVQILMKSTSCQFILTGSSARKLKRGGANLLAGRALVHYLFPLTLFELENNFRLEEIIKYGSLPPVVMATKEEEKIEILQAYTYTYLKEEIQVEALVRNLAGFSRFLEIAAWQSGDLLNVSSIAREVMLPVKTLQTYYDILEDTLIAFRLEPFVRTPRKRAMKHPKYYFFDLGVLNSLCGRLQGSIDPVVYGKLFEHYIVLETQRLLSYWKSEAKLYFWQSNHGAEVDLIIERGRKILACIEIKSKKTVSGSDLSGLRAFRELNGESPSYVVSQCPEPFTLDFAQALPWEKYFDILNNEILK